MNRSNLAKLWAAWQIISVVLITGYSVVFFTSLGNTPNSRLIYLALALILPVIAIIAWAVGITCYRSGRYVIACFSMIWGLILSLPTFVCGSLQLMINWRMI